MPHPIGHVRAHAHHEVAGDDANRQHQPGCELVTIDEGAEWGRARIGNCPFPEHGSRRGRALCERDDRARESDPRQQASRRAGSAVRERFPRSPEDKRRGQREGKTGTRRAGMNARWDATLQAVGARRHPEGWLWRGIRRAARPEVAASSAARPRRAPRRATKSSERVAASAPTRTPDSRKRPAAAITAGRIGHVYRPPIEASMNAASSVSATGSADGQRRLARRRRFRVVALVLVAVVA